MSALRKSPDPAEEEFWGETTEMLDAFAELVPVFALSPTQLVQFCRARGYLAQFEGAPAEQQRYMSRAVGLALRLLQHVPSSGATVSVGDLAGKVGSAKILAGPTPKGGDSESTLWRVSERIATRVLASAADLPEMPQRGSAAWRKLWRQFGVVQDGLSCSALCLGVRLTGGNAEPVTRAASDAREPLFLTLRMLEAAPLAFQGRSLFVCENPAVLEHAAAFVGPQHPAMLCTNGNPNQAVHRILSLAKSGDATIYVHADFDKEGVGIVQEIVRSYDAVPWAMSAQDYANAVDLISAERRFSGTVPDASWDPLLARVMNQAKMRVEEEAMISWLLDDIRLRTPGP